MDRCQHNNQQQITRLPHDLFPNQAHKQIYLKMFLLSVDELLMHIVGTQAVQFKLRSVLTREDEHEKDEDNENDEEKSIFLWRTKAEQEEEEEEVETLTRTHQKEA